MASSSITASLRVVGLYCLLEKKTLPGVSESSKVIDFMDAFVNLNLDFSYSAVTLPSNGKRIVDRMEYEFTPTSTVPPNAKFPSLGKRFESNVLSSDVSNVWQYYRSVRVTDGSNEYELKYPTVGQPSFTDLDFNDGLTKLPAGLKPIEYILTWRLARIQLAPDAVMEFMAAKQEAYTS